jgi:polyisoprenoid-binding protein YceI
MLKPLVLALALLPSPAAAASWILDPSTSVTADVGWQGQVVAVRFPRLDGSVDFDADAPEAARARIVAAAGAATTGNGVLDRLLLGDGFLAAAAHPTITFDLDRLARTSASTASIDGRLTLRGVTRPVHFDAEVFAYGLAPGRSDRFEAGFALTGSIDRTAFGSTGGLPEVAAVLPIRIRLLMTSQP